MATTTRDRARGTASAAVPRLKAAGAPSRGTMVLALMVIAGLLTFSSAPMAQAQRGGNTLADRVAALEARVTTLESENTALKSQVAALETQTQYLGTGTDGQGKAALFITGANVYIQDGTGSTASTSGLGNLTIGYNALGSWADLRTGSHNLILGDQNNYVSFGGLVAGRYSNIMAPYASVSGGRFNTASGEYASVSGGHTNLASGNYSSVSGGQRNTASSPNASVSGGQHNVASGTLASVSGGQYNLASGTLASVSGGFQRSAPGLYDWAAGGLFQGQ